MTHAARILLDFDAVSKRYGATVALDDVSFRLRAGEVCGLLGENGAGKSTLVKILSGIIEPDSGEMRTADRRFRPRNIVEARAHGVSTAFQELSLVPALSVAVNMFLPQPSTSRYGLVSSRRIESEAGEILRLHNVTDIAPSALVEDLPLGKRQKIEIVRALQRRSPIVLLDEPTAALTDRKWLFSLIDEARSEGTGILYISHKLDEIRRLCSRCIILRNGRKVLDSEVAALSDDEIFSSMAGRSVAEIFVRSAPCLRSGVAPALEAIGVVNGVAVALAKLPPFIATLSSGILFYGVALGLAAGSAQQPAAPALQRFMNATWLGVPVPVLFIIVFSTAAWLFQNRSVDGRRLYAIGGSETAARVAALPITALTVAAYAISGLCAGTAGILLAGYSASATVDMGNALLMPSIAAVVIGGARVTGGYGHYLGTLSGALFLSVLSTVITALSLSQGFRDVIQGAIILIALLLQTGRLNPGNRRSR